MTPTILALLLAAGLPVPPQASQLPPWYHWLFEAFRPAGGGSGTILTVTGVSPLALVNALAAPIPSITQYGKCVQNGTPTPSAPANILCNNGAIKYGTLGSNLYDPSTAVFEVGYYYNPNADGAQTAAQNNFIYYAYIPIEAGEAYVFYGRQKETNRISQYNRIHWYDESKTYIGTNTYTAGAIGKGVAPENAVYAKLSCNPQGANTGISKETVQAYNWTFCKGTTEVTPFVPFVGGIYADGTPEVMTITGKNLFNKDNMPAPVYTAYISNASGEGKTRLVSGTSERTVLMPIEPNTTYTVTKVYTDRLRIAEFSTIPNISPATSGTLLASDTSDAQRTERTITTGATAAYLAIQINNARLEGQSTTLDAVLASLQVEEGSTATAYEPYVTPQTASVPMLLGVGDIKDEAELISGIKTGKVGVKVFDGTEDWTAFTSSTLVIQNATSAWGAVAGVGGYCTHLTVLKAGETTFAGSCRFATAFNLYEYKTAFDVADVAGFKAKIAALYAAGTPVILVYPLATETTEQTMPHSLHSYNGTTIVTAQTNVDPVTLRAEYKGVST